MNPILRKLGFTEEDRVVVIHADDVGINYASIEAYEELKALGTISSGSVMAHSPWLAEVGIRAKKHPTWDLGVHLAFNCEYESYRWRPLTPQKVASGLVDAYGYFKQEAQEVMTKANLKAIEKELAAQIELVRDLGLDLTHVDTHSGVLWHPRFVKSYADVLEEYGLFPVIPSSDFMTQLVQIGMAAGTGGAKVWQELTTKKFPFVDAVGGLPMNKALEVNERFELAKHMLSQVEAGKLTHFAFHPMKDTEEARGLNRYTDARTADYKVFIKQEMKEFLDESGIQLIGYKEIREALALEIKR